MSEPIWKQLVESLNDRGFESRYLDRLNARLGAAAAQAAARGGYEAVQQELIAEMAYALQRSEDKVNLALLHLDVVRSKLESERDVRCRATLEEQYETHRRAAMRARWEFMVHREAVGMITHGVLEQLYPIPPRRPAASQAAEPTSPPGDSS